MDIHIPCTYDIIHDCRDCHRLGLLNRVISKYVLLSTFTEKEKKKRKVIFSLDMSILFVHTFQTARGKFFFLEKEPFVSNPRFSQIAHETTNFTD